MTTFTNVPKQVEDLLEKWNGTTSRRNFLKGSGLFVVSPTGDRIVNFGLGRVALVIDRPWTFTPDALTWAALLGLSLPGTAIAYVIYFRLLRTAGATNLMLVTLIIPVTAVLLGIVILGERPGPLTFGGMALILGGLVIIDGRVLRRPRMTEPRP